MKKIELRYGYFDGRTLEVDDGVEWIEIHPSSPDTVTASLMAKPSEIRGNIAYRRSAITRFRFVHQP